MIEHLPPGTSDVVLETGVSARGSLETGFLMSWLGLETFYKCLGSVSGPHCLGLGSVSTPYEPKEKFSCLKLKLTETPFL